jgi:DNA-binding PadR family transcriptional regulator
MLAVAGLGDAAYGMTVRRSLEERTGHSTSLGAVYSTLDRLEAKGYITSTENEGGDERGGRAKRFFKLTAPGLRALNQGIQALDSMRQGVSAIPRPARAS